MATAKQASSRGLNLALVEEILKTTLGVYRKDLAKEKYKGGWNIEGTPQVQQREKWVSMGQSPPCLYLLSICVCLLLHILSRNQREVVQAEEP